MEFKQREIKFRAWSKRNKKMEYPEKEGAIFPSGVISLGHGAFISTLFNEDWEIMQFTGLYDRNGVELYYDSDLLKLTGSDVVCWATKDRFDVPVFMDKQGRIVDFRDFFSEMKVNDFEIIGTKQENPELLDNI